MQRNNIKRSAANAATLSPKESIKVTGFGITHTYVLLRNGTMPSIKIGRKFYIPKNSLMRWLDSCGT